MSDFVVWQSQWNTGIPAIDEHHAGMVRQLNRLARAIEQPATTTGRSQAIEDSLKQYVDKHLVPNVTNVRTTQIGPEDTPDLSSHVARGYYGSSPSLSDEERDRQVRRAIMEILGAKVEDKKKAG